MPTLSHRRLGTPTHPCRLATAPPRSSTLSRALRSLGGPGSSASLAPWASGLPPPGARRSGISVIFGLSGLSGLVWCGRRTTFRLSSPLSFALWSLRTLTLSCHFGLSESLGSGHCRRICGLGPELSSLGWPPLSGRSCRQPARQESTSLSSITVFASSVGATSMWSGVFRVVAHSSARSRSTLWRRARRSVMRLSHPLSS